MQMLRQIVQQLIYTYKLMRILVKSVWNARYRKRLRNRISGAKENVSETISKKEKIRLACLWLKQSSGWVWRHPLSFFAVIMVALGGVSFFTWYTLVVKELPQLDQIKNQSANEVEEVIDETSAVWGLKEATKSDSKPTQETEIAAEKSSDLKEKVATNTLENESQNSPPLQPYLSATETSPLIRTINPQFLVEAAPTEQQRVSIILTGLGVNKKLTKNVLEELQSPEEVTLSFSPYANVIGEQIAESKSQGYSILLSFPLEDDDPKTDQGFLTLRTKVSPEQTMHNLTVLYNLARKCDGFYGEGGTRLLRSYKDLEPITDWVKKNKNFFVAPPDVLRNRLHELAAEKKLNYVCTTILNPTTQDIPTVIGLAKRTGFAVVVFQITPTVAEEIIEWINQLEMAKLDVVPITEIMPKSVN